MIQTVLGQRSATRIHGPASVLLPEFVHMDRYGIVTDANVYLANTANVLADITLSTAYVDARDPTITVP